MALGRSAASFVNDALGFAVLGLLDEVDEASMPGDASTGVCALADGASETAATCCSVSEQEEPLASPCMTKTEAPAVARQPMFFDLVCDLLDGALSGYAEQFGPLDPHLPKDEADAGGLAPV